MKDAQNILVAQNRGENGMNKQEKMNKVRELCKELCSGKEVLRQLVDIIGWNEILTELKDVAYSKEDIALGLRLAWAIAIYESGP